MAAFDPDAAARPGSGIFGLDDPESSAGVVLVPVPFAATVSYGGGAERGPAAMLAASHQVDLYDFHFGRVYEAGIHLQPADPDVAAAHTRGREAATSVLAVGGALAGDPSCAVVDEAGALVNRSLTDRVGPLLDAGKVVGVLGGDHSVPFGAIEA
ncbi:MAG: arginase family protein, partial [Planctomycetota bacterium]|nr:arginase family protein [Planctomycetota bacterium]